jgi:hypothetical protein
MTVRQIDGTIQGTPCFGHIGLVAPLKKVSGSLPGNPNPFIRTSRRVGT